MAARSGLMAPINETEHTFSRVSREGKRITYNLKVIQQPERARACGAGAKSSADRRPVDPPPVVELRVFESELDNDMNKTDITFAYNANFFLFATLENARPIAQGRVSGQPPTCPVLTGVPVAGIAYLDRPAQAGYFIFPDLSVRHEGFYRLNFNLYEEVKDPKDADKDAALPAQQPVTTSNKPGAPKAFLNFRLEVKSTPFQVYSAKKFPGLATSTSLSRVVAEQGCRVRIRRDVRMRRRGEKSSGKDYGEYNDEYGRSSRYTTPTPVERPRSASNSTVDAPYPYPGQTPRRDSTHEYPAYTTHHSRPPPPPATSTPYQHHALQHPPPPLPPAPASTSAAPGYLSFGSSTSYQTPQLPAAPPPPPSHSIYASGPSTPTSTYSSQPQLPRSRHPSNASEYEPTPHSYSTRPHHLPSILNPAPIDPPTYGGPSSEPYPSSATTSSAQSVPPRPHTPASNIMLPPISSLDQFAGAVPPPPPSASDISQQRRPSYYAIKPTIAKRTHEDSFDSHDGHMHKSIRSSDNDYAGIGHQPIVPVSGKRDSFIEAETDNWERPQMEYRRADGRMSSKTQLSV
ncbi:sexual development activator VeA [Talaromyces stipitatus ATCC 10500]|uniref:Developmental and secondary metabolism regulator veA n=1 Tax=Talaromyces stipitatus (strain ATCC 10500 / CBS 375.48 / QM 6759 / NRRL 1006) TaxID=441959 RepID=B8M2H5_TALSN|nr:sexual development activator VeA [Talaromyces stipitatus ATCC 10500]EED21639.1 sexual development activator VeA [Talaromyces stipitatus ATCC 10500]